MSESFKAALDLVTARQAELIGVKDTKEYIDRLVEYHAVKPEDRRFAVSMAVDAAKSVSNIGIAFLAALAAFALSYRVGKVRFTTSWPMIFLLCAAVSTVFSLIVGSRVISTAYSRGQKPADGTEPLPWATKPLSSLLGTQSTSGAIALLFLVLAFLTAHTISDSTEDTTVAVLQHDIDQLNLRIDKVDGLIDKHKDSSVNTSSASNASSQTPYLISEVAVVAGTLSRIETDLKDKATLPPPPVPPQAALRLDEANLALPDWAAIQMQLSLHGASPGAIDGKVGPRTRAAIRAWQKAVGHPVDGYLAPEEIAALLERPK